MQDPTGVFADGIFVGMAVFDEIFN